MHIISQNILVYITLIAMWTYLAFWAKLFNGPFERRFCFCRRKNRKKDMVLAIKLIGGISGVSILLYYVLCGVLGQTPVSPLNLTVIITSLLLVNLSFGNPAVGRHVGDIFLVIGVITLMPLAPAAIIIIKKIGLDVYCGYVSLVFFLADVGMAVKVKKAWMEGDV